MSLPTTKLVLPHLQTGRLSRESAWRRTTLVASGGALSNPSQCVDERPQSSEPEMRAPT